MIVIMVVVGAPFGVTVAGEKMQVERLGNPEQENDVGALNPSIGVTVSVMVGLVPGITEKEVRLAVREKSGLFGITGTTRVDASAIDFGASTFPTASVAML